jgi:predicted transcriptional regulator
VPALEKAPRDQIRQFIIKHLDRHPEDIANVAAEHFGMTPQAMHGHLVSLLKDGVIEATGRTRRKRYTLKYDMPQKILSFKENRDEDRVWRTLVEPWLVGLPENVVRICPSRS